MGVVLIIEPHMSMLKEWSPIKDHGIVTWKKLGMYDLLCQIINLLKEDLCV